MPFPGFFLEFFLCLWLLTIWLKCVLERTCLGWIYLGFFWDSCIWMSNPLSRIGKFWPIILLNMLAIPFPLFSPSKMPRIQISVCLMVSYKFYRFRSLFSFVFQSAYAISKDLFSTSEIIYSAWSSLIRKWKSLRSRTFCHITKFSGGCLIDISNSSILTKCLIYTTSPSRLTISPFLQPLANLLYPQPFPSQSHGFSLKQSYYFWFLWRSHLTGNKCL